jgi:hypothetical protein
MARHERDDRDAGTARDEFDETLERSSRDDPHGRTMEQLAHPGEDAGAPHVTNRVAPDVDHRQHARKGQAQSPVEDTLNQPPKHKEGHH